MVNVLGLSPTKDEVTSGLVQGIARVDIYGYLTFLKFILSIHLSSLSKFC